MSRVEQTQSRRVSSEQYKPKARKTKKMQRKAKTQDQAKARAGKQGSLSLKPEGMGYEPGRLSLKQGKLSCKG